MTQNTIPDVTVNVSSDDLLAEVENILQAAGATNSDATTATTDSTDNVVTNKYPDGTPQCVIDVLDSTDKKLKTVNQKTGALAKQAKDNEDVRKWAEAANKAGAAPKELREYMDVKKALREKLGIKKSQSQTEQVAKNIEAGANAAAAFVKPQTSTPVQQAPVAPAPVAEVSVLDALTPSAKPILRLVNQKTGRVFLLWTDLLAATQKDYQLRFRKYTAGDSSKLTGKVVPSVYLMKDERVLASFNAEEFIVLLNMVKQMTKNGKLDEIFQALVTLSSR